MTSAATGQRPLRLAEARKRTGRSQAEVATLMHTTQSGVSRLERQHDLRISTLRDYAAALGGTLRLSIEYADSSVDLAVEVADEVEARRSFRVIWQDPSSRSLVHVGWLEFTGAGFEFSYTDDARNHPRFTPFPPFPILDDTYASTELFAFFAVRLISAADPSYEAVLDAVGLAGRDATPVEILSLAPDPAHDTIQVVPEPTESSDGTLTRTFLVSGVRHADDDSAGAASNAISRLRSGDRLALVPEPTNSHNPRALQVAAGTTAVGWLPDYLVDEVHQYLASDRAVEVLVERANGANTPPHVRLQCRLIVRATPTAG